MGLRVFPFSVLTPLPQPEGRNSRNPLGFSDSRNPLGFSDLRNPLGFRRPPFKYSDTPWVGEGGFSKRTLLFELMIKLKD